MARNLWLAAISILLVTGLLAGCTPATTPTPTSTISPTAPATPEKPQLLSYITLDVGTKQYVATGFVTESIKSKFGISGRLIPIGVGINGMSFLRAKKADSIYLSSDSYRLREGKDVFTSRAWGPQPMRLAYNFLSASDTSGYMTRGNTDIRTPADLKGKKFPFIPGYAAFNNAFEAIIAFAGLTWDDVVKVEIASYSVAAEALEQGKTDIHVLNTTNPAAIAAAENPQGIRWIPLDPNDKEGWKRFNAVRPESSPSTTFVGAGVSKDKPCYGFGTGQFIDAYDFLDEDTAYWITKTWSESYDIFKDKQISLEDASLDNALMLPEKGIPFIWHPGSIRYIKETGKWTPQLEAWNSKAIEREDMMMKAWATCIAEADANSVKETDLPALWEKYRAEIPPIG